MKKSTIFRLTGIIMIIAALLFLFYAINNPQASFPWSNTITYGIYGLYLVITVLCFFKSKTMRRAGE